MIHFTKDNKTKKWTISFVITLIILFLFFSTFTLTLLEKRLELVDLFWFFIISFVVAFTTNIAGYFRKRFIYITTLIGILIAIIVMAYYFNRGYTLDGITGVILFIIIFGISLIAGTTMQLVVSYQKKKERK